jgi:radical SAM protein with 4Fe4S-binding SPASM domain
MNEQCWINPIHAVIDAVGDVYICCYYQDREQEHKIGNVFETPFEKIWGSPLHREKIKSTKIKECLKHDCRFQKYMATIRKAQKHGTWDFV